MIEDALARINPIFRAAVVLRDVEDLSYEEIADVLDISSGPSSPESRAVAKRCAVNLGAVSSRSR